MRRAELDPDPAFGIRHATVDDAQAIAEVNLDSGRVGWADFVDRELLAGLEPPVGDFGHLLSSLAPPRAVLVAIEGETIVGFATVRAAACRRPTSVGELGALYTRPAVWGRGAGRLLMEGALEELRAAGFEEAVLWTEERNARPRRIYKALGWRPDGATREREFLGRPIRELRYRRSLTDLG